jgi:hypothetical protein
VNKKYIILILIMLFFTTLVGCNNNSDPGKVDTKSEALLYNEANNTFLYFMETTNFDENSIGYGMARDRYPNSPSLSSIAATGFMLASLPYGVENNLISFDEAKHKATKTLNTLVEMEHTSGFYYHFVNMKTTNRSPGSEVSIIDTGLLLAGAIVAAEYFKGEVKNQMQVIYDRINWDFYINKTRNMFYMGYQPEKGFSGAWDHVSEQLLLYVLAAGSSTYPTGNSLYRTVKSIANSNYKGAYRSTNYETDTYIYSYNGSLFQHQFSHAFIDFRNIVDKDNTNWHENARQATLANYYYTKDNKEKYKAYEKAWGLSASDHPKGYLAFGAELAKNSTHNGTIAPYASIASVNYTNELTFEALKYFDTLEELKGDYGYKDAFNLGPVDPNYNPIIDAVTPWYANDYIGIDKGITLLMIANYQSDLIWNLFMKNENVKRGLEILEFKKS